MWKKVGNLIFVFIKERYVARSESGRSRRKILLVAVESKIKLLQVASERARRFY